MGSLGCCGECAKCFLILLNLLFLMAGFTLLGVGIWLVVDNQALQVLKVAIGFLTTADLVWGAAIIIIIVSCVVIIVGGMGFCGAFRRNTGCLNCYSSMVIVLLIMQVIALILAGAFYAQIMSVLKTNLNTALQSRYGQPNYQSSTTGWNIIQVQMSCCGVVDAVDWKASLWAQQASKNVPEQCCVLASKRDYSHPIPTYPVECQNAAYDEMYADREKYINYKGCEAKLEDWLNGYFSFILGAIIILLCLQLMIIILACVLRSMISKSSYEELKS